MADKLCEALTWHSLSGIIYDMDVNFGHWLAGFTAGEGCFQSQIRTVNKVGTGWHGRRFLSLWFTISLRSDDEYILLEIQRKLGVGKVARFYNKGKRNPQSRYSITHTKSMCEVLIPLFDKCLLRNKKQGEYEVWKRIAKRSYQAKCSPRYTRTRSGLSGTLPYSDDYWALMQQDNDILRSLKEYRLDE